MAGFTPSIYRGYIGSWEDSGHADDLGLLPVVIFGSLGLVYGADEEDR